VQQELQLTFVTHYSNSTKKLTVVCEFMYAEMAAMLASIQVYEITHIECSCTVILGLPIWVAVRVPVL